jgi:hypothetical protein
MDIKEDEVKEIKNIGNLHGSNVKLITLKGGFHIGMGRKKENSKKNDILAVGSHPALVMHQISKKYEKNFEENLSKNESNENYEIYDYSSELNSTQKNVLGLDVFLIKKNEKIDFKITKHNFEIFSIKGIENEKEIILEKINKNSKRLNNLDQESLSKSLQKTISNYANKNNLKIKKSF